MSFLRVWWSRARICWPPGPGNGGGGRGLTLTPVAAPDYMRPFFTTVGMTDESCGTVYGYCTGEATSAHQEPSEDIQVILADRAECRRILREEKVAIMCAYMLMHFIATPGDPLAFLQAGKEGEGRG